jgi:outer membrane protein assembly factor BamE
MRHATSFLGSLALAGALLLSSGCIYHMPIIQGNFLDEGQVAQLEPGMTRSQVMFLIGTPMVPNGFNTDRWDYYYYVKVKRLSKPDTKRLTVWFKDDKVDHVERSDAPATPPAPAVDAAAAPPAAAATPAAPATP